MYVHKLNLKKTKFMNKMIMNRLTMLAVTLMASMACFAQGKGGETTGWGAVFGPNYQELSYSVTTNSIHVAEVTGFASYVLTTPKIMDDPEAYSPDPNLKIEKNTIIINHFMTGSPSVWIPRVADNAFASVASDLASRIKTIKIDFKGHRESSNTTQDIPVVIGENAFAGLTSVKTVFNYTPGKYVKDIKENAFATSVYENATLVVPTGSMPGYANTDGWSNFYIIVNADGYEHGDVNIDNIVNKTDITIFRKWLNEDDDVDYDKILDEEDLDFNNDGMVNKTDITALREWMNRD